MCPGGQPPLGVEADGRETGRRRAAVYFPDPVVSGGRQFDAMRMCHDILRRGIPYLAGQMVSRATAAARARNYADISPRCWPKTQKRPPKTDDLSVANVEGARFHLRT